MVKRQKYNWIAKIQQNRNRKIWENQDNGKRKKAIEQKREGGSEDIKRLETFGRRQGVR